jgi:hypothetical protein
VLRLEVQQHRTPPQPTFADSKTGTPSSTQLSSFTELYWPRQFGVNTDTYSHLDNTSPYPLILGRFPAE